ncbi:MAG: chitobiase/beta-hexosaminidase C-terminal domain-containing protein [Rariglobus sp.]|nr:chitobiase/beta-hexosaminidase C-terminal domain-containing protein [Rariglobus sp.]
MKATQRFVAAVLAAAFLPLFSPGATRLVDQRGGAPYTTISAAVAATQPGDTIILAAGSGPYRVAVQINKSGTASAPITFDGNGETVTGFDPMVFTTSGGVSTYTLPASFASTPVVIAFQGTRILQATATGAFLGPISLRADGVTFELAPGTSTAGWEISKRIAAIAINNHSYHVYRNVVASGSLNDGFNIHGNASSILFENVSGHSNLDEGFSAHDDSVVEILGGEFWHNDNGIGNNLNTIMVATNVLLHDNLGRGLRLHTNTASVLTNISSWNNGVSQLCLENQAEGSLDQVRVWTPTWSTPPWRRYMDTIAVTTSVVLEGKASQNPIPNWTGLPQLMSGSGPGSGTVTVPSFSPGGGTYTVAQSVTLTTATSGASIRYTTDGSTPTATTGTVYSSPVAITSTATLKAIAYKSGMTDSTVTTATYTINASSGTVSAPSFSPAGGTYTVAQSVTLTTATSGATIRYTTDGSTPTTTTGTVYSSPVAIASTATLKAIAYKSGMTNSTVTIAAYTINTSSGTAWEAESLAYTSNGATAVNETDAGASGGSRVGFPATAIGNWVQFSLPSVPAGTYTIQLAYKSNINRGQATFQVDGTAVGGTLDQYASSGGPYLTATLGTVTFSSAATHTFRLTVSGKAASSSGYVLSADRITLVAAAASAAAPVFSPSGGTFTSTQSVTISTATSGASIRYTTDGSTPTATSGTLYASPVSIASTATLKAIAYKSGMTDSTVTTATYTINAPAPTFNWEAESLAYTSSGATAVNEADAAASGGSRVGFPATAIGNWVQFTLPSVPAGTYTLQLAYKTNINRGQASLQVDGAAVGGTLDQYASSGGPYLTATLGTVTFSSAGTHTFRLTVSGKASASSGYVLSADKITLVGQ